VKTLFFTFDFLLMMQSIFSQNIVDGFNDKKDNVMIRVYKSYYPVILNKVMRLTGGSPEVYDLVQDIFLKIIRHKGRFNTIRNIENFIKIVTERTCLDHIKRRETRQSNSSKIGIYYQGIEYHNNQTARNRIAFHSLIYIAIEKLPKRCRHIFLLYYLEDLKNKEIAKLLAISEKTVEIHKNYAIKKLRMEIKAESSDSNMLSKVIFLLFYLDQLFA
jgi:RNA polymerase sigma-70 factor, ECF subfamily